MLNPTDTRSDHELTPQTHEVRTPRSGWRWVIPAAGAWSALYAVLGMFWALGGRGLPLGRSGDPSAELSVLGAFDGPGIAAVLAGLGFAGALVALAMHRTDGTRRSQRIALQVFAWSAAIVLTLVVPDFRVLMSVAYTPILLVGAPFGWPEGASLSQAYPWPTVNQLIMTAGGALWAAAAVTHHRRAVAACGRCGRGPQRRPWTTPEGAARWGRWAVAVAVVIPLLYAATRWAWALGIPLGITEEFLAEGQESGMWMTGAALASLGIGGAVLTLGLAQRWGEVFPRWIPRVAGRPVPPRLAIIPAAAVSVLVTTAGVMFIRLQLTGYLEGVFGKGNWAAVAPELLWPLWGGALAAGALAYHYRRRGPCPTCGRD